MTGVAGWLWEVPADTSACCGAIGIAGTESGACSAGSEGRCGAASAEGKTCTAGAEGRACAAGAEGRACTAGAEGRACTAGAEGRACTAGAEGRACAEGAEAGSCAAGSCRSDSPLLAIAALWLVGASGLPSNSEDCHSAGALWAGLFSRRLSAMLRGKVAPHQLLTFPVRTILRPSRLSRHSAEQNHASSGTKSNSGEKQRK